MINTKFKIRWISGMIFFTYFCSGFAATYGFSFSNPLNENQPPAQTPTPAAINAPTPIANPLANQAANAANAQMLQILSQILNTIRNVATNYLGFNLNATGNQPFTPSTYNIQTTQIINPASAAQYNNTQMLELNNVYNIQFDQPPAFSPAPTLNEQMIYNALTLTNPDLVNSYIAGLTISAPLDQQQAQNLVNPDKASTFNPTNNVLNMDSLLGPTVYVAPQNKSALDPEIVALHFIRMVSGQADPIASADGQILKKANVGPRNQYLALLRAYISNLSVGTGNLFQLMAKRHLIPNLGAQAGLKTPDTVGPDGKIQQGATIKDASELQVENYIASRRVLSPSWYQSMEKAPPITVERETLYVLAEIENQLNELRRTNERILATLSVMELQQARQMRPELEKAAKALNPPTTPEQGQ